MKSAKEMFEEYNKLFKKTVPINRLRQQQKYCNYMKANLLYIKEKMEEWLKKGELFFNISSEYDIDLVYKIFRNKDQYTFGSEPYHYFHININKRGIYKLTKMIAKNDRKLKVINQQLKELEWLDEKTKKRKKQKAKRSNR